MSSSQWSDDSQDPAYFPSQTSPARVKRNCTEEGEIDATPRTPRLSATQCYKKLKSIEDMHMLDDNLGSQEWLEGYLGRMGVKIPDDSPAAGDSDIEEGPESQVPEENLQASVFYRVNLSPERMSCQGVGEHAQNIINEMKEQLESTDHANQKLRIRSDRMGVALKAMETALKQKKDEINMLQQAKRVGEQTLLLDLENSERHRKLIMEQIEPMRKELDVYKGLIKYLGQALTMDNPQHLSKLLEVWGKQEHMSENK